VFFLPICITFFSLTYFFLALLSLTYWHACARAVYMLHAHILIPSRSSSSWFFFERLVAHHDEIPYAAAFSFTPLASSHLCWFDQQQQGILWGDKNDRYAPPHVNGWIHQSWSVIDKSLSCLYCWSLWGSSLWGCSITWYLCRATAG
jgi:hypothetical protein